MSSSSISNKSKPATANKKRKKTQKPRSVKMLLYRVGDFERKDSTCKLMYGSKKISIEFFTVGGVAGGISFGDAARATLGGGFSLEKFSMAAGLWKKANKQRIELQFKTITGMQLKDDLLEIQVNGPPRFSEQRPNKNFAQCKDFTSGETLAHSRHILKLVGGKRTQAAFDLLYEAEPRFKDMIDSPEKWNEEKFDDSTKDAYTKSQEPKPKRRKVNGKEGECSCKSGCKTKRCACFKEHGVCGDSCACSKRCKNMFNELASLGVAEHSWKRDECFLDHVGKMKNIKEALSESVSLGEDICEASEDLTIKDVIGGYECSCGNEYDYSFCSNEIIYREMRPRNHCAICKRCGDYRDQHCDTCNKCYFAGLSGFPCPTCGDSDQDSDGTFW